MLTLTTTEKLTEPVPIKQTQSIPPSYQYNLVDFHPKIPLAPDLKRGVAWKEPWTCYQKSCLLLAVKLRADYFVSLNLFPQFLK